MKLKEFAKTHNIGIQYMSVPENPTMVDHGRFMNNYFVVLNTDGDTKNGMGIFFSMGVGINRKPTALDVLECLKSDITHSEVSFNEFCSNFGYDTDSRQAEETYHAVIKQTLELKRWLGNTRFDEFDGCDLDY